MSIEDIANLASIDAHLKNAGYMKKTKRFKGGSLSILYANNSELYRNTGDIYFFDTKGIDELISYLDFLKNGNDPSMHLNTGNELDEESQDNETHIIHSVKLINVDKLGERE